MTDSDWKSVFLLSEIPFGRAFEGFLGGYFDVADYLYGSVPLKGIPSQEFNSRINAAFESVRKDSNHHDPHIVQGGLRAKPGRKVETETRASLLIRRLFERGRVVENALSRYKRAKSDRAQLAAIFSPMYFIRQVLTDPAFPASDAYAHAVIRAYIFDQALRFHVRRQSNVEGQSHSALDTLRTLIGFESITKSLAKLERHRAIRDNVPMENATDFIVYHILASRGFLMMRLRMGPVETEAASKPSQISLDQFFKSRNLDAGGFYEFRIAPEIARFPEPSEVLNELDGLPIPIPGADIIFQGGIRSTESLGVVTRLSGSAGTGKTSFALSLALALAPLGTRTIYFSCEEQEIDLLQRVRTLEPEFIARTSSRKDPSLWFSSAYVAGDPHTKFNQVRDFLAKTLSSHSTSVPTKENTPPGMVPLFIVIDGVHEMFSAKNTDENRTRMRELVEACQQTGALVLVMSAADHPELADLDYLVDLNASLSYAEPIDEADPPTRIFNLTKTRRQISRSGRHVLHLSGAEGLRFSPQVGAQLDYRRRWRWIEPDESRWSDFLLRPSDRKAGLVQPLVRIYDRAHVLVSGQGSSGKSAFALRTVCAQQISVPPRHAAPRDRYSDRKDPTKEAEAATADIQFDENWTGENDSTRRNILVISFLYQPKYYEQLKEHVIRDMKRDSLVPDAIPTKINVEVRTFSPGFLRPEDFIRIISNRLDSAELDGEPFQAVVLDGIHNVYLQFPHLERHEMVWPMLYEMLRTRGVMTVTTHTHFHASHGTEITDVSAARRRVGPLLHALVQSTDLQLSISPLSQDTLASISAGGRNNGNDQEEGRLFEVTVETSTDWRRIKDGFIWLWDRKFNRMVSGHKNWPQPSATIHRNRDLF